ncbi:MAG: hypothetical protein BJ554DRAFT_1131 [Olpidium bornovanus]|uniref:NTF2 domain-containing protein n=1 Tax=Olpidium bornovanus TaxID=278681 RepID=A0A8H7ZT71_9FUNG|nr:MAG: hypothetical protein BJ554DRAFT_1131 [Olpidium bornovanus]
MGSLNSSGTCPMVVTVCGTVKLGDFPPRGFSQSFVLQPDPQKNGNFFVRSDCHRFVGPDFDATPRR